MENKTASSIGAVLLENVYFVRGAMLPVIGKAWKPCLLLVAGSQMQKPLKPLSTTEMYHLKPLSTTAMHPSNPSVPP